MPQWTFAIYFFVILYAILFYSLCTLLVPPGDWQLLPGHGDGKTIELSNRYGITFYL